MLYQKLQSGGVAIVTGVSRNMSFVTYKPRNDKYNADIIGELEKFIQQYKHLPGIPTANEIKENGPSLSQINAMLLKKIEELTLYVIELNKKLEKYEKH